MLARPLNAVLGLSSLRILPQPVFNRLNAHFVKPVLSLSARGTSICSQSGQPTAGGHRSPRGSETRKTAVGIMAEGPLKEISRDAALALKDYRHACHTMLYAPTGKTLFNNYDMHYMVMMQMRFDGKLGFPGGLVDDGETLEQALNRELQEEIGFADGDRMDITADEHLSTHVLESRKLCLHFYVRSLTREKFERLEKAGIHADHFGTEVLGVIRCPTYRIGTTDGGLPSFLRNSFVGNARQQLLMGITHAGILNDEQIKEMEAVSAMRPNTPS